MGRFSSVQTYGDYNSRAVSYDQAVGANNSEKKGETANARVKTDKVVNPFGSTAGAGSSDFHIYRHARAREIERIKNLTTEEIEKKKDQEFELQKQRDAEEAAARTAKKREKRKKAKDAKIRKKNLTKLGIISDTASALPGVQADEDDDDDDDVDESKKGKYDATEENKLLEPETEKRKLDQSISDSERPNKKR